MEPDIWFMVAWMVGKHGADAPRIAEEMLERMHREFRARSGGIEESDIETWRAIRNAAVEWLDVSKNAADVVR
jgi:hypothetical protein